MITIVKEIFLTIVILATVVAIVGSTDPGKQYIDKYNKNKTGEIIYDTVEIPQINLPMADALDVRNGNVCTVDISNVNSGYVMIKYFGTNQKIKINIQHESKENFYYDLNLTDNFETYPLIYGSGKYILTVYEHINDTYYDIVDTIYFTAEISNEREVFLYPNHYTYYEADSELVSISNGVTQSSESEVDTIENIFNYVIDNIEYDYDKASSNEILYVPDLNKLLDEKKGVCLDYAALTVAMLRSKGIPAKLVVGYANDVYHAWVSVYTSEKGIINGNIPFEGEGWVVLDPTLADTGDVLPGFAGVDTQNIIYTEMYVM